ncbi:MAG: amidase [Candidatus Cloacimonetes bacterium]|nr:amidase [Candidatus Cloacimonadota bacterium]
MYYSPISLKNLAHDLRSGKLPLSDYIEQTLRRMEEIEPIIHSFIPEEKRDIRLLFEAKALLERYPDPYERPPLFGVLVGVKDIINVDRLQTLAGSKLPPEVFQGEEADIVTILKSAGAIILGKTVCTEFAYFQPGETTNPHNPKHTPGGSSSGSAAAVAAGISPLTVGTQTIASVIRPAAYCGVVGFKPSYGRVSMCGVFPLAKSADHLGFFTADVESMKLVVRSVISNWHKITAKKKPLLAIPASEFLNQAEPATLQSFNRTLKLFTKAGFEIRATTLFKNIELINELHQELLAAEFAVQHHEIFWEHFKLYSEHSKSLYKKGLHIRAEKVKAIREQQLIMRYEVTEKMEEKGIDLLLTPAATRSAPLGLNSTGSPLMSLPWTFAGLPSITIPSDNNRKGLPLGLQLIAPYGEDENLLAYAKVLNEIINCSV